MSSKISAQAKYTHFQKKNCNILVYILAMYKSKYHSVLSKYTSGFKKHKSNIDMTNNCFI